MSFGGLYISISGIYANKKSLDTISHNISNVNNPNYVRQRVTHAERRYSTTGDLKLQTGTGVNVQEIRQIRDEFLDIKLRREMATFGYYNAKSEILGEVEDIFDGGFQEVMDDFWNGWTELSKEPDSLTIRGLLHENATAFTTTVNHMSTQLDNLQYNLNKEMLNKTEEVNKTLKDISGLNKSIKLAESYGENISANDYRDSRNAALDRLSQLIPITHYENKYGEEVVSLHGKDLVNGDYLNPIEVRLNDKGHGEIYWSDTGEPMDLKGLGELGGYIDARDKSVVEYKDRLNIMVKTIANKINEIHITGVGLDNTSVLKFFEFDVNDKNNIAANIKVNPELKDFNKIAASKTGDKGDGEIAKAILDLREKTIFGKYNFEDPNKITEPGTITADGFYRDLILNLGLEREQARSMAENQTMLIRQIDERRKEISSVSLDEEMADMLKYQHSYIANSRVINAIDEMMDQVINRMGVVGR
jgi:flagellar hook-associated protein 1 FlgK